MDIDFVDNEHLITQSIATNTNVALKCNNCSTWYQKGIGLEGEEVAKSSSSFLDTETQLWNSLAYIYGVSWTLIKNYNSKKETNFPKTPDDLRFCNNCTSLLNDNYNSHLKFEQSSDSSSIVQLLKEFRDYLINSSEKQTGVQFVSNDLVEAVERDIKVDLPEDFVVEDPEEDPFHSEDPEEDPFHSEDPEEDPFQSEDPEEDPFQSEDPVDIKYEPPPTSTEYLGNNSEQSRSGESPALRRLRSRQLVIKTEKMSPDEILQYTHKNAKKNLRRPKKRKRVTTVKNPGKGPNVPKRVKEEESPFEEKTITPAAQGLKTRGKKAVTKKKIEINPGLSFEEKVKLVMEKYKESTKCNKIRLKGQFICTVCGKGFKDFEYLKRRHWPNHQEDAGLIVCDICGKSVKKIYIKYHNLRAHATEEDLKKYKTKCNFCEKVVLSLDMSNHLAMSHSKVPEEKCNQCGKVFVNKVRLKIHELVHTNASEKCDLCDKVFTASAYLKNHKKTVHGKRERKYCCEICPHKSYTKTELDIHKLTHTDLRRYICDECGKTFKYRPHFLQHMKCHKEIAEKGEMSVTCDLCDGKTFKHSLSLKKHMLRIHGQGKTKIHECSVCSKQLSSATILKTHENMHKANPGFVPRVRTKLPEYIVKGQNSSGKLAASSKVHPISTVESTNNISP